MNSNDIYTYYGVEEYADADGINAEEAGFMMGYIDDQEEEGIS